MTQPHIQADGASGGLPDQSHQAAPDLSTFMTFGYQLALRNRVPACRLERGGKLDIERHPPWVLVDVLQLPGSLANAIGLESPAELMNRMTPATMRGWTIHADPSGEPILRFTGSEDDTVSGMMVLGRGQNNVEALSEHYGEGVRVEVADVEIELKGGEVVELSAYVWVKCEDEEGKETDVEDSATIVSTSIAGLLEDSLKPASRAPDCDSTTRGRPTWTIERYIAGRL